MANIQIVDEFPILLRPKAWFTSIFRGYVTDPDGNPLARTVLVYERDNRDVLVASTTSNADTGFFQTALNENHEKLYHIVVVGDEANGENSVIINDVTLVDY